MADVQVKTRTAVTREHFILESDVILAFKLDAPKGLSSVQLIGVDGVNKLKIVILDDEQVADSVIVP